MKHHDSSRRRGLLLATVLATAGAVSLAPLTPVGAATPVPTTIVNDPPVAPHVLGAFPSRDFLSAEGQVPGDTVVFEVTHSTRGGDTVASQPFVVGDDGLAEVNHPGGTCWDVVTPDIVPGDTVRVVVTSSPGGVRDGQADVTTVADVRAGRPVNSAPGTITVTGHAASPTGAQLPLDELEARLVAPNQIFTKSGKRDLRAPGTRGAALAYDDPGSTTDLGWTATWTGLSDADVQRALGAEGVVVWLGRDPAAGVESTSQETGAGIAKGPAAPCTAPRERLAALPGQDAEAPTTPTGLDAVVSDLNTVTLTWDPATDNTGVTDYGIYRNGVPVFTVQNADSSAPAPTTFVDRNVPPGSYTYTVDAADALDNRSAHSEPAGATAAERPAPAVPVSDPPVHPFTIFPSRDMINVDGVEAGMQVRAEVIRAGRVVSDSTGLIPDETGLVEINHAGSYCWAGTTPDIRAHDRIRATAYDQDGNVAWIDEAVVSNVTAGKAQLENGVVTVHGTAVGHDGRPLPVDQIEQRMVTSSRNPFGVNGKRTIRADSSGQGNGTLSYDPIGPDNPVGIKWTATYPSLDATDRQLALGVESRVMWLGRDPLAGLELTIYEVGLADPPGPAAPDCVAPFEPIDVAAPSAPAVTATAHHALREVDLAWTPSRDDSYVYGYRVFRDGQQIAALAGDQTTYTATGVTPGAHTFAVEAYDAASAHGAGTTDEARITSGLGGAYGNTSEKSAPVSVTLQDVQAPSVPQGLTVTNPTRTVTNADGTTSEVATNNARLVFDPSVDDSGSVARYRVYRNGALLTGATPTLNANGKLVYTDTKLTPNATYRYAVDAVDAAGNASARTDEVLVTIALDNEKPLFAGDPTVTVPDLHGSSVVVTWAPASDNIGVTGYGIYRDGTRIAQVNGTTLTYRDTGLAAGTYRYKVDAVDSAGNRSDRSVQTAQTVAIANDPPVGGHTVIAYPARDFVEGDNYVGAGPVVVEVFRDGKVVGRARTTPDATGLVEVNHAGPGCWGDAGFPNTPDLRAGDIVRITPDATGVPDQTTVSDAVVQRPVQTATDTVVVHGTAADAAGRPLPLDQLEARMVSTGNEFRLNGRRTLRAPTDGTIAYDAAGSTAFTATFRGLVAADVTRALNADMVVSWLGRTPLTGNELTIVENGVGTDGGPAAGSCTAPLDPTVPLVTLTPANRLAFGDQGAVPATTSAARTVTITNAGASPMKLTKAYLGGANPGDFSVTPTTLPASLAPGASTSLSVKFSPKTVGARSATLSFVDNAANTSYQTIDLSGVGVDSAAPSSVTGLSRKLVPDATITGTVPVTVSWNASTGRTTHYTVQRSVGGAAFVDLPADQQPAAATFDPATGDLLTPAATTIDQDVATGSATRYQVRACNGTNCTAYTAMPAFTLAAFQENNGNVSTSGTWNRTTLAGSFGGSVSSSSTAKTGMTLKTTGTGFQIISTRGPDRGNAEVWLDSTRVATINLYAPTLTPARVVFTREGLANATHQVELRALGSRTAPATGNRVDLDGFIALR